MGKVVFVSLFVLGLGCGSSASLGKGDLGRDPDMAAPPDLESSDLADPFNDASVDPHITQSFVVNAITLPRSRSDFAIDLNGDGKRDNQLGNIVATLIAENIDAQVGLDDSIKRGENVELVGVITGDPTLRSDPAAIAFVYGGLQQPPDFTGGGSFNVDPKTRPAEFDGVAANGSFVSDNPVTTSSPTTVQLRLSLFSGAMLVPLRVQGAQLRFSLGTDGPSGAPGLVAGQINGSISNSDVQGVLVPAVAAGLTKEIQIQPPTQGTQVIAALFDIGDCTNANGVQAYAGDGVIDPCEVAQNPIISSILSPDVQIFDSQGHYAPSAGNRVKDSLSVGLGFTAVRASF